MSTDNKQLGAEIAAKINGLNEEIKTFKATESRVQEVNDEIKSMKEELAKAKNRADILETEMKKVKPEGREAKAVGFVEGIRSALLEQKDALAGFANTPGGARNMNLEVKTPINMLFSNAVTGQPSRDLRPGIVDIQRRRTHVRELIPQTTTSNQIVSILRETGPEGGAGMQTEGSAKSKFSNTLTVVDFKVQTIADFAVVSDQMLNDIDGLVGHLNTVLPKKILELEDTQLLTGNGATVNLFGLGKDAITDSTWNLGAAVPVPQNWDVLARTIGFQMGQNFDVNFILLNPVDLFAMLTAKGQDGQYVSPLIMQGGQAFLYGVPVFMNTAVTAGKFYLGDNTESYIAQRSGLNVRFFDQDEDNVKKNMVTVRAEQRLAHVILRPTAYVFGDFEEGIADLTASAS